MKQVIIIGAGLGGLATACRLAKAGFAVSVFEKTARVGGKVNLVEAAGYRFDTGASLLTMRHVLDELFEYCGRRVEDYLDLVPLETVCRYFWTDGARFDASSDLAKTENGIAAIEPLDVDGFRRYLEDARRKYEIAERTFLAGSLNDLPKLLTPANFSDLLKISTLKTLDKHHAGYFRSPKLRQLFNRFATYNGSSPYRTPATFALISYVEFGLGAWYARGGMYEIPRALERLARELGVRFFTETEIEKIVVEGGRAVGVRASGETVGADLVVANADAIETHRTLLGSRRYLNREPSCSGFVLLLGTRRRYPQLAHHNIFFSDDYRAEFDAIFERKTPAADPTVYVCATSRTDPTQAPEGRENLFVLVNAPSTNAGVDWREEAPRYRELIVDKLETYGFEGLRESIEFEKVITPADFEEIYGANRGSIYGVSSNGVFSAFLRVPNKSRDTENLYFAGGAAHPGGGIPLVLLSGKMTAEMIVRAG
ncbi:MAG: phytoene desaturase [Acidobacteria bacterium]|nr:phytoene desaturase [Acidobacteriota bacterium]